MMTVCTWNTAEYRPRGRRANFAALSIGPETEEYTCLSVFQRAADNSRYYLLVAVAGFAVVTSLYYYLNVIRAAFADPAADESPIHLTKTIRATLCACMTLIVLLGVCPQPLFEAAFRAIAAFGLK